MDEDTIDEKISLVELDKSKYQNIFFNSLARAQFNNLFKNQVLKKVIKILSPQILNEPYALNFNNYDTYNYLLKPIEAFIVGLPTDPESLESREQQTIDDILNNLKKSDQPSGLCRKILKSGDPIFSCNDCGYDSTCVFCIDCFNNSPHKNHNYRMSNSGGGCCDCGDVEAWKQYPACSDHKVSNQNPILLSSLNSVESRRRQILIDHERIMNKIKSLPDGLPARFYIVCQVCLNFAHELITWKNDRSLPAKYNFPIEADCEYQELYNDSPTSKNFFTVLFNDETHTYEQVISTLVKVIKCDSMTASIMAATISRDGRAFVAKGDLETCKKQKIQISRNTGDDNGGVKVGVIHGKVLAYQIFALKLISLIQKLSKVCETFKILVALALFESCEEDNASFPRSLLENVMLSNTHIWKIARIQWNDIFVTTMLNHYSIKDKFSRILTRNYGEFMKKFIQDDHELSVSVLTLTAQFYTVPTIVNMLIEEENALTLLTDTLLEAYKTLRIDTPGYKPRHTLDLQPLKRGFKIVGDLRFLTNIEPPQWTARYSRNVLSSVKIFLELLDSIQGMDSVKRQQGHHVEYEPEWESGMILQQRLAYLLTRYIWFVSRDYETLRLALTETLSKLKERDNFEYGTKELFGYRTDCILYDVSKSPVTVHLPLTRFAAALTLELMIRSPSNLIPYDQKLVMLPNSDDRPQTMIEIMEPSLRTQVMIAQYRSGMWRRNGYSLINQLMYYHSPLVRKEMYDRDILVIQECAAVTDANDFLLHLINKFNLMTWLTCEAPDMQDVRIEGSTQADYEIVTQTISIAEEFLQLILTIIGERYRVGIGKISEDEVIEHEIIQALFVGPATRSEILTKLQIDIEVTPDITVHIQNVANLKRSSKSATGCYELKPEYQDRYNPYFYHHGRRDQSNASATQLRKKKNDHETLICFPPPRPVELTQQFSNLNELLRSEILLNIIQTILRRSLEFTGEIKQEPRKFHSSYLQLDKSLHLVGLGLFEQERRPIEYNYLESAHKAKIFELLLGCLDTPIGDTSKDLIRWVINKSLCIADLIECSDSLSDITKDAVDYIRNKLHVKSVDQYSSKFETKKRNSEVAAKRRERIMNMMKASQQKFLDNNQDNQSDTAPKEEKSEKEKEEEELTHHCILCREKQKVELNGPAMVFLAHLQRSTVLSKNRQDRKIPFYNLTYMNYNRYIQPVRQHDHEENSLYDLMSDNSYNFDATFMPSDLFFGPHISTCGHMMHLECWKEHFEIIQKRELNRPNRQSRHVSFDVEKFEILCPYCCSISNLAVPIIPNYTIFGQPGYTEQNKIKNNSSVFNLQPTDILGLDLSKFITTITAAIQTVETAARPLRLEYSQTMDLPKLNIILPTKLNSLLTQLSEEEALGMRDFLKVIRDHSISMFKKDCDKSLLMALQMLSKRVHNLALDMYKDNRSETSRVFMMLCWSLSYTLHTTEQMHRLKKTSIFYKHESTKNLFDSSLIRSISTSVVIFQAEILESLLIRKLRYLLLPKIYLESPISVLDIDAVELFVSLTVLMQKLYSEMSDCSASGRMPTENSENYAWSTRAFNHSYFRSTLQLTYIFHLIQIALSFLTYENKVVETDESQKYNITSNENPGMSNNEECSNEEKEFFKEFFTLIIITTEHPNHRMPNIDSEFLKSFRNKTLPYLRCCALFYLNLTGFRPITKDKSKLVNSQDDEFIDICAYLGLPVKFKPLFASQNIKNLVRTWLKHSRVSLIISKTTGTFKDDLSSKNEDDKPLESTSDQTVDGDHPMDIEEEKKFVYRLDHVDINETKKSLLLVPFKLIEQPHSVNRLVELPQDYSELIERISTYTCPKILNEESRTPTMCLVCGVILCSQSYCCQRDLNDLASMYSIYTNQNKHAGKDSRSIRTSIPHNMSIVSNALNQVFGTADTSSRPHASSSYSSGPDSVIAQQLVGSCCYHAYECSAGVGVFLRIRTCEVLLLSGKSKGCYMPAPYIDDHGETDFGLRRGNPLHLNKDEYNRLQDLWLSHSIPERISRELESSQYLSNIGWYLH